MNPKKVILKRAWSDDRATIGMLTVVDFRHDPIFTLENPLREVLTDSRIPAGFYRCRPYSGTRYKDVYIIENVPFRDHILIHWGNFESDTLGCVLLGNGAGMLNGKPAVTESKAAFARFRDIIGGLPFELTIV